MPGKVVPASTLARRGDRPAASSSEGKERASSPRRSCQISSSPAQAGDPVRRGPSIQLQPSLEYWITRPSAQLRTRRVMTAEYEATISRHCVRDLLSNCLPQNQRAQGRPGACCTRGLACDLRKQQGTRAYRAAGASGRTNALLPRSACRPYRRDLSMTAQP